jgi:hypothetical protein
MNPKATLHKQVSRVSQRLFLQIFLNRSVWCLTGVLLLTAIWLFAHPFVFGLAEPWLRWTIIGGGFVLGIVLALGWTFLSHPSQLSAALALDQQFGLKERVTTSLTLTDEMARSLAGQALLADMDSRLASLHVGSRFPVKLSRGSLIVPLCLVLCALVAIFFEPDLTTVVANPNPRQLSPQVAEKLEKKYEDTLKKIQLEKNTDPNKKKSKELEEVDIDLENLKAPANFQDEKVVREKSKEIKEIENKLDNLIEKELEKVQKKAQLQEELKNALQEKQQLQDAGNKNEKMGNDKTGDGQVGNNQKPDDKGMGEKKPDDKGMGEKNPDDKGMGEKKPDDKGAGADPKKEEQKGPGDGLKDALSKGDLKQAQQEAQKLQNDLKDNKLSKEDLEKLKKQMDQMQQQLKQTQKQDGQQSQELKDLAKAMECKDCKDGQALADKLQQMENQLDKAQPNPEDLKDLQNKKEALKDLRQDLVQGLNDPNNQNNNPPGLAQNGGGKGGGPRPFGKEGEMTFKDEFQETELDPTGQFQIIGFGKSGGKKGSKVEIGQVQGELNPSTNPKLQEAIDQQRIPPETADALKAFYENLSGPKR